MKVAVSYDIGGRGDQSFNDAAARGLDRAKKKYDIETKEQEPRDGESDADKVERLKSFAAAGFDPIISVGYTYAKPVEKVAKKYPKTNFAIVDTDAVRGKNITNLTFAEEEGSFLVGAAAALKTKKDHVGFIGGVQTPLIEKFDAGYQQGVRYIAKKQHKKIKISRKYLSQPPSNSGFRDPAKGKSTAKGQLDAGADVIYPAAGASSSGAIEAAAAAGAWSIGVDSDMAKQPGLKKYKDKILTSMVKDVDGAVYKLIRKKHDKTLHGGVWNAGVKEDGVQYSRTGGHVEDIKPRLDKIAKKIASGEIKVSETLD